MEMAQADDPRPGRVPELVVDGGGALYCIWENPSGVVFFVWDDFIGVGGCRGGARGAEAGCGRDPPLTRGWDPPLGYAEAS